MQKLKPALRYATTGLLAIALSITLVVSGCSFSSTVTQIGKYLPVGIQAFETILSLLAGAGRIKAGSVTALDNDANLVSVAFSDIRSGVDAYNAAPASDKATKLQSIVLALVSAEGALTKLESDTHMGSTAEQLMVNGLLGVIVTTLTAFEVNLGGAASPAKLARASAAVPSVKQFKAQFNAILVQGGHADKQLR
jgi:hypothetical protein